MTKTAVILFNLGGSDEPKAVKPFLFNLFRDPAIITLPNPLRWIIAKLITLRRTGKAKAIYQQMGGKSPILNLTLAQADALEQKLNRSRKDGAGEYKVFVSMRYWHPMSKAVVKNVKNYDPGRVVLLPLYPQFSTATTASSFADWKKNAESAGLKAPTSRVCCYAADLGFIAAHVKLIKDSYWKASEQGKPRVLFSAHGLPEKTIAGGDPYQWQVEKTVAGIVQIMAVDELDYAICYQSRVGPLKWIGPSIDDEIARAGKDGVPVVVVPVAFVSEHSETLVELDIEYRRLAEKRGVPAYWRTPALGIEPLFIETLADLCLKAQQEEGTASFNGGRYCSRGLNKCPCV
jgi:ferrochelatase